MVRPDAAREAAEFARGGDREMPVAEWNGRRFAYRKVGGSGDPTALIHGSWSDRSTWESVLPGLSQGLEVLSYDRRGHGESDGPPRAHPVRDDARDLGDLLESLQFYPAHLVAHSYGGAVALRLAVDRPEFVRSVTVHEPPFLGLLRPEDGEEATQLFERISGWRELVSRGEPEQVASEFWARFAPSRGGWAGLPPVVRSVALGQAAAWAAEFGDPEALSPKADELREIAVPALVTYGSESPEFSAHIARRVSEAMANASLQALQDTGHVPQREDPDQFVGLLGTFLLERNVPTT